MISLLPSVLVLGLAAWAAYLLARGRRSPAERASERRSAARVLALSVVLQGVHFAEEASTGFTERLGAVFGLPSMPYAFFIVFNVLWIGIWIASVPGVRAGRSWAFFAAWFLAVAGMANGLLHPLLAVASGGYFPGTVSSSFVGLASVWLWVRLRAATRPILPAA